MIWKRITRYVLFACIILCGPWLIAGCLDNTDHPMDREVDCSTARLSELVDEALASVDVVDMDTAYDEHLLSDPWAGERAYCESTAPDATWREGPWIKTRELCVNYTCLTWNETNFDTGFGVLKDGTMTLDTLRVESVSETSNGWELIIACGEDDGAESLYMPLRVYGDVDTGCLGGINAAVAGYIQIDSFWIFVEVVDGVVDITAVDVNDLYVHVDLFGIGILDDLISDMVSSIAGWMESDIGEFFGPIAKERVEAAYDEFVAECP
jgi:hypothetical protein